MNKKLQVVDAFDERLPKKTSRIADPDFIRSFVKFQIAPILVNVVDGDWRLIAGNRRLSAARLGTVEEYGGKGKIEVALVYDLTIEEERALLLVENSMRSDNPAAQYKALQALLKEYGGYKEISESWNIPVKKLKKMAEEWCNVPAWAAKAVEKGNMSVGTAKAIAKLKPSLLNKAESVFEETGKLTTVDLTEFEMVRKAEVSKQTVGLFAFDQPLGDARNSFSRMELQVILNLLRAGSWGPATNMLEDLLKL